MSGATFASALRKAARQVIASLGKAMVLRKKASSTYSPSSGATTVTWTSYPVTGVVSVFDPSEISSSMAEAGDVKIVLAAEGLSVAPAKGDEIVLGADESSDARLQVVADATETWAGEGIVIYAVRARG